MGKKEKWLGIDLSLNCSAYVILEGHSNKPIAQGLIQPGKRKLRDEERLAYIEDQFNALIDSEDYKRIGIEGYSFGSRGSRAFSIGEAGGVVKLLLHKSSIDYNIFPPTVIKKYTTGKGNALKSHMMMSVFKKWRFETDSEDIADAYAIAHLTREYHGYITKRAPRVSFTQNELMLFKKINGELNGKS